MSRTAVVAHVEPRVAARPASLQAVHAVAALPPRARTEELLAAICLTGVVAILLGAIAAAIVTPALSRHGATVGLAAWACGWSALWMTRRGQR